MNKPDWLRLQTNDVIVYPLVWHELQYKLVWRLRPVFVLEERK